MDSPYMTTHMPYYVGVISFYTSRLEVYMTSEEEKLVILQHELKQQEIEESIQEAIKTLRLESWSRERLEREMAKLYLENSILDEEFHQALTNQKKNALEMLRFSGGESYKELNKGLVKTVASISVQRTQSKAGKKSAGEREPKKALDKVEEIYIEKHKAGHPFNKHGRLAEFYKEMEAEYPAITGGTPSIKQRIEKVRKGLGHTKELGHITS